MTNRTRDTWDNTELFVDDWAPPSVTSCRSDPAIGRLAAWLIFSLFVLNVTLSFLGW